MRHLTIFLGTGLIAGMLGGNAQAAENAPKGEPVKAKAVQVQTDGDSVEVTSRRYPNRYHYDYRGYNNPPYHDSYYYGPYDHSYEYGPRYHDPYDGRYRYYHRSYYNGPAGIINVYPGGMNVGGLHIGW